MIINEKVIRKNIIICSILLFIVGCDTRVTDPNYIPLDFELDTQLPMDENGYYHLELNDETWQTIHRISGTIYDDVEPAELIRFNWYSSHYWYIGDTLGYVIQYGLTDDLEYVSYDTSYVTWFDGWEVPTINCCSYSNSDGEVNVMIAPVRSMVGDTMTIWFTFRNYSNELEEGNFYIILD